jgi:uncharacterized protein (DUF302 family)
LIQEPSTTGGPESVHDPNREVVMPNQRSDIAQRADNGERVVTKVSPWSVADTVSRVSAVARARGMKVFAVIDHSGEADASGLELRETKLVIFGSPEAGTPVMVAVPLAALDLPQRVLVWADEHVTKVSYTSPGALAARYGLNEALSARLASIDALTNVVIDR